MDYAKYDTVEAVVAFVDRQPLAVKKVLNVPWIQGAKCYRLDTNMVRSILETSSPSSSTIVNPRKTRMVSTHALGLYLPHWVRKGSKSTEETMKTVKTPYSHSISQMKEWIPQMKCRACTPKRNTF
jgi:hypothetical protein